MSARRHGFAGTPTYNTWRGMKKRCQLPSDPYYAGYGGRGITVCERWLSFENFLADMGERPAGMTLDRKDNDKGYAPGNCRWSSPADQSRNRRSNRLAVEDVELIKTSTASSYTLGRELGVSSSMIRQIRRGVTWG